MLLMKNTC